MIFRLALLSILFTAIAAAESIPRIEAKAVSGKTIVLPDAVAGRPAVLIFGFSKDSNKQTEQWSKRLHSAQVPVYTLPVLESVPRLIRGLVVSGIKGGTAAADRDYMLPVFSGEAALKQLVQFSQPDDAYVVVLDASGKIQWKGHGVAPETMQKCESALSGQ
jgi:hypothetical protein